MLVSSAVSDRDVVSHPLKKVHVLVGDALIAREVACAHGPAGVHARHNACDDW